MRIKKKVSKFGNPTAGEKILAAGENLPESTNLADVKLAGGEIILAAARFLEKIKF